MRAHPEGFSLNYENNLKMFFSFLLKFDIQKALGHKEMLNLLPIKIVDKIKDHASSILEDYFKHYFDFLSLEGREEMVIRSQPLA